jgi:hypothetical protein
MDRAGDVAQAIGLRKHEALTTKIPVSPKGTKDREIKTFQDYHKQKQFLTTIQHCKRY